MGKKETLARAKSREVPFTEAGLQPLLAVQSTPFHIIDEGGMRSTSQGLNMAFPWVKGPTGDGFMNHLAVKANPAVKVLKVARSEGMGADCSSEAELILAERAGFTGEEIMFTSNNTPPKEFGIARRMGAIINVDDLSHLPDVLEHAGVPPVISFRYNPGKSRVGNSIIGHPEETKFGMTKKQLFQAYDIMHAKGVRRFGLHTMVASNERNTKFFVDTAKMLFGLVGELSARGINMEFVNLGGGIGIPYKPGEKPADLNAISKGIQQAYDEMIVAQGLGPLGIHMENGRLITGPNGYLVASVVHNNRKYRRFVGLDASLPDLLRAGIYNNSYHHATLLGKEDAPYAGKASLTGRLCEGNDVFVRLPFPATKRRDLVVFHDTGAHGAAMGNNYNGYLRAGGYMRHLDGSYTMVHRPDTMEQYINRYDVQ